MRLTADELLELKQDRQTKVWRFREPNACEVGQRYSTAGEYFTVMDVRVLSKGAMFRHFPKLWEELSDQMGVDGAWMITVVYGDQTDQPRLLAPTGSGADYTNLLARAMPSEPEAIREDDLDRLTRPAREASEAKREVKRKKRRLPQRMRSWANSESA